MSNNINDTYFDGHYKEIWRTIIPDDLTLKELEFILSYFNLQPGNKVIDLMCGFGRHSLSLARKGMLVTAIDNLDEYVLEIEKTAKNENLPLIAVSRDILTYKPNDVFNLAICMGNSLNFFDAKDTVKIFKTISSHLRKNGHLLINTWSLAEIAIKSFNQRSWNTIGDLKCMYESRFLFHPTRIETESIIIGPDGKSEKKAAIDYIFSINEIEVMLEQANLSLKEIYSIPGKKKFHLGEPRAYLVAEKL